MTTHTVYAWLEELRYVSHEIEAKSPAEAARIAATMERDDASFWEGTRSNGDTNDGVLLYVSGHLFPYGSMIGRHNGEYMRVLLGELLEWAERTGGWDAECWKRVRALHARMNGSPQPYPEQKELTS